MTKPITDLEGRLDAAFKRSEAARALGSIRTKKKSKSSAANGGKVDQIRARLTIYGHGEMSDKEFSFFKKWLTELVPSTAKNKRGELSKVFRQTLYKVTKDTKRV